MLPKMVFGPLGINDRIHELAIIDILYKYISKNVPKFKKKISRRLRVKVETPINVKIRFLDMLYVNKHPTNYWTLLARNKEFLRTFKFIFWTS